MIARECKYIDGSTRDDYFGPRNSACPDAFYASKAQENNALLLARPTAQQLRSFRMSCRVPRYLTICCVDFLAHGSSQYIDCAVTNVTNNDIGRRISPALPSQIRQKERERWHVHKVAKILLVPSRQSAWEISAAPPPGRCRSGRQCRSSGFALVAAMRLICIASKLECPYSCASLHRISYLYTTFNAVPRRTSKYVTTIHVAERSRQETELRRLVDPPFPLDASRAGVSRRDKQSSVGGGRPDPLRSLTAAPPRGEQSCCVSHVPFSVAIRAAYGPGSVE